ncbi:cupin domain-containing protein [Leptospira chreensis]|uniref:cupin domain-containing protein n=1 Tax=Leptospira chreensis TaxID=2810035 RepID=UPI001E35C1A1|nr:cupin domain-containing protein [Leptospira chreensis]
MKLKKTVYIGITIVIIYVLMGNILHRFVFPEPTIPADVYPIIGDTMLNPFAKESFVVLKTDKETNGAYAEVEMHLDPGGAVPEPHIHPQYNETFKVVKGELTLVMEGVEHKVGPGQSITVPKGVPHQPFNRENIEFVGNVSVDRPAKWALFITQFHGFLTEKKEPRTNLEFFLQAMLVTDFYEDTYLASPPIPVQKVLSFIVAPTARLLGHQSWKPEISKKWRKKVSLSEEI